MPERADLSSLPVVAEVDVLVCGGGAPAVAHALECSRLGMKVFVAAPRPFLGEDIVESLGFTEAVGCLPGLPAVSDGGAIPTPMQVKSALESALVEAGVPFLLGVIPAGVVVGAAGRVHGVRLASRSGFIVALAGVVVDATEHGVVCLQAGLGGVARRRGRAVARHVTLAGRAGVGAVDRAAVKPGLSYEMIDASGAPQRLGSKVADCPVDLGDGGAFAVARAFQSVASRTWEPGDFLRQERLVLVAAGEAVHDVSGGLGEIAGLRPMTPSVVTSAMPASIAEAIAEARRRASIHLGTREGSVASHGWSVRVGEDCVPVALRTVEAVPRSRVVRRLERIVGADAFPLLGTCDVLVLGGGTGGAPASIGAARAGARVVVVESLAMLGGVGTAGQIARYWFGNKVGFTAEMDAAVAALEVDPELREGKGSWSPAAKSAWLERECTALGVTLLYRSLACAAVVEAGRVTGLVVATPWGAGVVKAGCVVDATGCADVAAMVGAPTRSTGADHVAVQGTGLAGVWPGKPYHNSDHGFCDDTDVFDSTAFQVAARRRFPGAFDVGQLVDSRERRQIIGEIELDPCDFLAGRRYGDTVCVSSSNFDSHGFTVHPLFACKPPTKVRLWADLPLRALLPRGIERLLVTGLGLSAHRDVLPVVRMQADVQNHGYAAGLAAALAATTDTDLRALPIRELQRRLVEIGILPQRALADADNFPPAEAALREAVESGWDDHRGLALLFADPARSVPLLRAAWQAGEPGPRRMRHALVLALLGDPTGAGDLAEELRARGWDEGWNFRGMHQFGMSASAVDVMLSALGRVGGAEAWAIWERLALALGPDAAFSHVRAVAESAEALHPRHPDPRGPRGLTRLLALPGMTGHATRTLPEVLGQVTTDPNDNLPRNLALRELHLARALWRCGDPEGLAKTILESYATDLRGHFARHALAVLGR